MAVCSLGCGRLVPEGSEEDSCGVCRANMAWWSRQDLEHIKHYDEQLGVRKARMDEVRHATKSSYVGRLQAKRARRSRALGRVQHRRRESATAH